MRGCLLAAAFTALAAPATAAFPDHPIKVIVPYAAGGPADVTARLVFNKAGEKLGQSFLIDNRTGAGGNIGTAAGAQAAPDGYTLTLITPAQIINMTLFASPGYDVARDFVPVSLFNTAPGLLLVNPKLGVSSLRRVDRAGQEQARTVELRQSGCRRRAAPDDGDDQDAGRHRPRPCAVSRLGARVERSSGRHRADHDRFHRHRIAACEIRRAARHRGVDRHAFAARAGHSDHGRSRGCRASTPRCGTAWWPLRRRRRSWLPRSARRSRRC